MKHQAKMFFKLAVMLGLLSTAPCLSLPKKSGFITACSTDTECKHYECCDHSFDPHTGYCKPQLELGAYCTNATNCPKCEKGLICHVYSIPLVSLGKCQKIP